MKRTNCVLAVATAISASILAAPQVSVAELYVSPIIKHEVKNESPGNGITVINEVVTENSGSSSDENVIVIRKQNPDGSFTSETSESGKYLSNDLEVELNNQKKLSKELNKKRLLLQKIKINNPQGPEKLAPHSSDPFGRDVPLEVAIKNIVPDTLGYLVNIEEGLTGTKVSWNGGDSWEDVLQDIAKSNNLFIHVNKEEQAIGVSKTKGLAPHYAHKTNKVWKVDKRLSLRGNLSEWAKKAGWQLAWDDDLKIDYPIQYDSTIIGDFAGNNSVVKDILSPFANRKVALRAVFYKQNNVLLIKQAGFKHKGVQ